eukprot:7709840-Pyramimonas_sp.AAC.1
MIKLPGLFHTFRQVGSPLHLGWMGIQTHAAPRRIDAVGSLSEPCVSFQGILAGCSAATSIVMADLLQSGRLAIERIPAQARASIGDASLHWSGPDPERGNVVPAAARVTSSRAPDRPL